MAQPNLHQRLALLQQSLKQTAQLIVRLAKTQSNVSRQSLSVSAALRDTESGDIHALLSAEIHETLKQEEEELELLQQDINDLAPSFHPSGSARKAETQSLRVSEREREYVRLCATCNRLREELKSARVRFRRAQLQSKRNAEIALRKEQLAYLADLQGTAEPPLSKDEPGEDQLLSHSEMRNNLLSSNRRSVRSTNNSTKEDILLTASSDLTSSLRRTHDILTSEVSRSRFAHDTLATSNSALAELNKRYGALDDMLARSRGLLGSLLRSQKSDTWYLETALYLLLGTMAWLLFRRLLYGPAWWILWQPMRLLWNVAAWVSGGFFGIIGVERGVSRIGKSADTAQGAANTPQMLTRITPNGIPNVATVGDSQGVGGIPAHRSSIAQQDTSASMSEQIGAIFDSSRVNHGTVETSSTAHSTVEARQENKESSGDTEETADRQSKDQKLKEPFEEKMVRRGDGEALRERDPAKEPPNPKKRMWEEPSIPEERKDEL